MWILIYWHKKLEGGLKQFTVAKQLLERFHMVGYKPFKESIIYSLKHGLIAFFVLLFSLGFFEYIQGVLTGNPVKFVDQIDFAIAFLGFFLMFAAKLLERLFGKH